jgi:hypothetical protein
MTLDKKILSSIVGLNLKFLSSVYAYSRTLEAFFSWTPTSVIKELEKGLMPVVPPLLSPQEKPPPLPPLLPPPPPPVPNTELPPK